MESPENSSPLETVSLSSHEETTTRNKTTNHPRRFSNEQIKSLESLFNLEPKLEPRKKLQIATDLGLHPHQVAIWFQNKRARWKSKQIGHQYKLLKSDYDDLSTRFEDLKREKLSLQIQELSNLVKKDAELKEYPNSTSEGMDHNDDDKIMANYFEKTCDQELVSWREDEEEEEEKELSQTWRNLSTSFAPSTENSNWWEN